MTSIEVLVALAASVLVSCTAGAEREKLGRAASRLGAETPAASDAWKIVQGADFNADGMTDALWVDPDTNRFAVWLMAGTRLLAAGPVMAGPIGDGWVPKTAGNFNHDGMADVLFFNKQTNAFAVWLMNGAEVLAQGPSIPGPLGADNDLAPSVPDFNADGLSDVLFVNTKTNVLVVCLMNGAELLAQGPSIPGPVGAGWSLAGGGDFNADGVSDIVWNDSGNNRMVVWLMRGATLLAAGPEITGPAGGASSTVVSAGDYNADGMADVVWSDAGRTTMAVWLMAGTTPLAAGPTIPWPMGDFSQANDGDFNADGMVDLVWHAKSPPRMAVWLMHGTSLAEVGPEIPGPEAP